MPPCLDEFANAYSPGFFTRAEPQGLWEDKFGKADRIMARKQRLMVRCRRRVKKQAIDILRSLLEWLMRQRYLIGNPWVGFSVQKIPQPKLDTGRSFTARQWAFLEGQLEQLLDAGSARRLKFVMSFAYGTGLRPSGLVNSRCKDLEPVEFDAPSEGWVLRVVPANDIASSNFTAASGTTYCWFCARTSNQATIVFHCMAIRSPALPSPPSLMP